MILYKSLIIQLIRSQDTLIQIPEKLNETKAGESYTIKWMTGMPETMEQIRQYDVSEGKTVQII